MEQETAAQLNLAAGSGVFRVVQEEVIVLDRPADLSDDDDDQLTAVLCDLFPQLVLALSFYTGSRAVAEDVAQDSLVKAWEHRAELAQLEDPRAWVFRVAINRSRSIYRRFRALRKAGLAVARLERPSEEELVDRLDVRDLVRGLPRRQRLAVLLRYYGDLSVDQTAEAMGCAPGTVKALTSQARDSIRSRLEEER